MSLIVRTGLRTDLPPTGSGYTQKTLAELQTYTAAAHLGQVIQVTDRAEAPNTFTWAYSVGTTWKSVYTQTVVSSDPSTLHPLKAVTQWNSVLKDIDSTPGSSGYLGYALRLPMRVGGTVMEFDPLFTNWYKKDSRDGMATNSGFAFQIDGASLEYNGVTKPITFSGGSRSVNLANGEPGIFPDPVPTTAWGVASIPAGTIVYLQLRGTVPTGGSILYNSMQPAYISGCQSWLYNKTNTTISSVDAPGAMSFTGAGVPEPREVVYMAPLMFGRHTTADAVSLLGDGDSIGAGVGDNQQDSIGYGYINRLAANAKVGCLNLSVGGSRALDGLNDIRITSLFKYGTHAIINYGTNNPESASAVVTLIKQREQLMKAAGVKKVLIAYRLPLTTSSDNWTTVDGQTVNAGVQASIASLNSAIEAAGFDGTLKHSSVHAPSDYGKWLAGTSAAPAAYTVDGTHPGAAGGAGNAVNGYAKMYAEDLPQYTAMVNDTWDGFPTNNKMAELGHSFIANGQQGSTSDGYRSYGVATGAADESGQVVRRLGYTGAFGNGGDDTVQIDARFDAALAACTGGVLYVYNGINDGLLTVDTTIDTMKAWKQKAFAAKTVLLLHTIAPCGNDAFPANRPTTAVAADMKTRNARMLAELPGTGCLVVDSFAQLLKPGTDFDLLEKWSPQDGKHPGNLWVQQISAPADAAVLKSLYPNGLRDKPTATSAASINTNIELTGASTTAGATPPTGYTSTKATGTTGATLTYQEVTTATGRWCQFVFGGTVATANAAIDILRQISLQAKLVTGKTYEGVIEYEYDAGIQGILSVQLGMQEAGSSTLLNWDNNRYATQPMSPLARKGWMRTPPFTAIDGLTDHRFRLSAYMGTDVAPVGTMRFRFMENREVAA